MQLWKNLDRIERNTETDVTIEGKIKKKPMKIRESKVIQEYKKKHKWTKFHS